MKKYGVNELRKMFLDFMESKGHLIMKSFSLVPQGDKSPSSDQCGNGALKAIFYRRGDPAKKKSGYLPEVYPYRRYRKRG